MASALTCGVSKAQVARYPSRELAGDAFNIALKAGLVKVCL